MLDDVTSSEGQLEVQARCTHSAQTLERSNKKLQ